MAVLQVDITFKYGEWYLMFCSESLAGENDPSRQKRQLRGTPSTEQDNTGFVGKNKLGKKKNNNYNKIKRL
jgi:hypothetical protein